MDNENEVDEFNEGYHKGYGDGLNDLKETVSPNYKTITSELYNAVIELDSLTESLSQLRSRITLIIDGLRRINLKNQF